MSKNRGSNSFVYSSLRPFWTKYFRRFYLWNINSQPLGFESFEMKSFTSEYFRQVYLWNINSQPLGFESFEITNSKIWKEEFWTEYFWLKREKSKVIRFRWTRRFPKDLHGASAMLLPSEPDPFCDDNPSNIIINTVKHCDHYALIILPLTIYRHKTENPNPKKKSTV